MPSITAVLNQYDMPLAYYALVELDTGSRVEFKIKKAEISHVPTLSDWQAIAANFVIVAPAPVEEVLEIYNADGEMVYP